MKKRQRLTPIEYLLAYPLAQPQEVAKVTGCTIGHAAKLITQRGTPPSVFKRVEKVLREAEGRKDDTGKLPWHLLPGDALEEIVKVLQFGANKYAERNWEAGMKWSRPFAALMRHSWAWWRGEQLDKETGLSHLAHAGCCLLFLLAYSVRNKQGDDRPKENENATKSTDREDSAATWMHVSGDNKRR